MCWHVGRQGRPIAASAAAAAAVAVFFGLGWTGWACALEMLATAHRQWAE